MSQETLTRSVVFAVALGALFVGHSLGDHIAQTDRQAARKSAPGAAGWRALAGHLLGYHLTVAAVMHGLLDRRWPVRAVLRATRSPEFAETTTPVCGMYVADQALHHFALLVT